MPTRNIVQRPRSQHQQTENRGPPVVDGSDHLGRGQAFLQASVVGPQEFPVDRVGQILVLELASIEIGHAGARYRRNIERPVSMAPPLIQYPLFLGRRHGPARTVADVDRAPVAHRRRVGREDGHDGDVVASIPALLAQDRRRRHDVPVAAHVGQRAQHPIGDGAAGRGAVVPQPDDRDARAARTRKIVGEGADCFAKPRRRIPSQRLLEFDPRAFRALDHARQLVVVQSHGPVPAALPIVDTEIARETSAKLGGGPKIRAGSGTWSCRWTKPSSTSTTAGRKESPALRAASISLRVIVTACASARRPLPR